jgi:hypothetical protein
MKKILLLFLLTVACAFGQQVDPGFGHYRNTALSSTDVAVKTSTANLFGFTITNVNTTPVYVKFYNGTTATVTVGTTVPVAVVMVPAGDGTTPGSVMLAPGSVSWLFANTGLVVAAVTGIADNSTAAPSTAIYIEVQYK